MNYKLPLLLMKNKARLEKMILNNVEYAKILKQSQKIDRLINEYIENSRVG